MSFFPNKKHIITKFIWNLYFAFLFYCLRCILLASSHHLSVIQDLRTKGNLDKGHFALDMDRVSFAVWYLFRCVADFKSSFSIAECYLKRMTRTIIFMIFSPCFIWFMFYLCGYIGFQRQPFQILCLQKQVLYKSLFYTIPSF